MRFYLAAFTLALTATVPAATLHAQQEPSLSARIAVRRDLEQAKANLRYYWQVEYPRKMREIDAAIECTRADICNNNSLLREYRPFSGFSIGEPFPITVRNLQMCIKVGELRLNDLLAERNALVRFRADQFRALAADVYEARVRVVELEANMPELTLIDQQPPNQQ